ncbi:DsbA family protein [Avibacterium paragallinarum]|uniref:DsbA family protein n=1 Tax=Avibacterium paragallinarum TaxID=728 RepID=A0ABU7QMM1_AVIPA|nr:DsbA family protein [Avibacterium paragallinarum]
MKQFIYLYDPLCGWCYGASPHLEKIAHNNGIILLPTGLFTDSERIMDQEFAHYAWSNDQRISKLTGVTFSQQYQENILQKSTAFDSRTLVNALAWVSQSAPEKVFNALKRLQKARYVEGLDTTKANVVSQILSQMGIDIDEQAIIDAQALADQQIAQGQQLAQQLGLTGVPQLLQVENGEIQALPNQLLFDEKLLATYLSA